MRTSTRIDYRSRSINDLQRECFKAHCSCRRAGMVRRSTVGGALVWLFFSFFPNQLRGGWTWLVLVGPQLVHRVTTPVACAFHGRPIRYAPHPVCVRPV